MPKPGRFPNRKGVGTMKLIVCSGYYGHCELATGDKVESGPFAGLDQRQLFGKIMQEGYGNNVPAIFFADMEDVSTKKLVGKDAATLLDDPQVREVTVIAPIAGG
jgi:hypothetical protein